MSRNSGSEIHGKKIAVVGLGYVGLSNAVLLAQRNDVVCLDVDPARVDAVNGRRSPIVDAELEDYLRNKPLRLRATLDRESAYAGADFVVVATPTDYDPETRHFDTRTVEAVIADALLLSPSSWIIVKSTIPIGFTSRMRKRFGTGRIVFSPEFLREGKALYDNLHPSRIVVGSREEPAREFAGLLRDGALVPEVPVLLTDSEDAEAIKLFANTYLAMRVAYFNELDSFALRNGLDARRLIEGVCLDPRIGMGYNNPSFGYGGYCLPKDSRQLLANFEGIPQKLMGAIVEANSTRKDFLVREILEKSPGTVGVYRLVMKAGSDNFRSSSIQDIMRKLREAGREVVVFEPTLREESFQGFRLVRDLAELGRVADVILANRVTDEIRPWSGKVFSRDVFGDC